MAEYETEQKSFLRDSERAKEYFCDKFPHPTFREGQKEAVRKIAEAFSEGYKYVVLDAPTGAGKSAINTAFARGFSNTYYTTPQNSLVDQIEADTVLNKYYETLKGKANYECQNTECKDYGSGRHTAEECLNNQESRGEPNEICCDASYIHEYINAEPDDEPTFGSANSLTKAIQKTTTCDYPKKLWEALQAENVLTNTFLFSIAPFLRKKQLAIIDESHNLEQVIFNFVDIRITTHTVPFFSNIKDDLPREDPDKLEDFITDDLRTLCEQRLERLREQETVDTELGSEEAEEIDNKEKKDKIKDLMKKIKLVEDLDEDFVIEEKDESSGSEGVVLKPIYCGDFFQEKIAPKADNFILSSATFTNAEKSLQKLGVDKSDIKVVSMRSYFPEENRPVDFRDVTDLRRKHKEKGDFKEIAEEILSIMSEHEEHKGIVHCGSYRRQGILKQILESLGAEERIMGHGKKNSDYKLGEFKEKDDNTVFLSVAKEEGIDLEGDHARFNILVKMPNPSMNDERTSHRVFNNGEWEWYFMQTATRTVQSYGRTTRSQDDWSNFYILDSSFRTFSDRGHLFPDWFKDVVEIF